jgi:hypothetical protein
MKLRYVLLCMVVMGFAQVGCVSSTLRFPSSTEEIYGYNHLKQNLLLAAQNNVLFHIPQETLFEIEKNEIDSRCKETQKPFWTEKLSVYLNMMQTNPEWFSRFHVIEIKKGDAPKVVLENDLDGATILSIQYGKVESRGVVNLKTNMPCSKARLAEYLGKEITKTQFEFPTVPDVRKVLNSAGARKTVKRFEFSNQFISYLAERGFILKFNHEISFEKNTANKFVFVEVLNKLSRELGKRKDNKHVHLWMKILNDARKSDEIIQMFSLENQKQLKSGLKFSVNENSYESQSYPYLYMSYNVDNEMITTSDITDLNECLAQIPNQKTNLFSRQPTAETLNDNRFVKDYSCTSIGSSNVEIVPTEAFSSQSVPAPTRAPATESTTN